MIFKKDVTLTIIEKEVLDNLIEENKKLEQKLLEKNNPQSNGVEELKKIAESLGVRIVDENGFDFESLKSENEHLKKESQELKYRLHKMFNYPCINRDLNA